MSVMNYHLGILTSAIIQQSFLTSRCLLKFTDSNQLDFSSAIPVVNIGVTNGTFQPQLMFNYFGCQGIILHVETPVKTLLFLEEEIRRSKERFNHRRYIFLPVEKSLEDVMDVFKAKILEFIADVIVVNPKDFTENNQWESVWVNFDLFSHRFTGINGSNEITLVNQWMSKNCSFVDDRELYPDKLHNGYGRTLRIATFSYKPYSVPAFNEGIDLQMGLEFCEKHNLTPSMLIDEEGEWGDLYSNWTGFGIMGNILADAADVGLGSLYTWESAYVYLDLTKPLVRTGITCLVPAPRLAAGWLVPFLSFTPEMWIAVGLTFFVCSLVLFLVECYISKIDYQKVFSDGKGKLQALEDAILYTSAIFLLQSVPDEQTRNGIKKYIYSCLLIFSLLVTTVYSSGLASSMTVPRYEGAIKTVQDLVDSGIQWGATSIAWLMSILDAKGENYRILLERFVNTDEERLKYNNDKRFAFSIERLSSGYYAIGDYVTQDGVSNLRIMSEDIYWEHCVFMARKSSIWTPILDNFILTMMQTGIPSLWEYKVATTHLNANVQRAVTYSSHHAEGDSEPKKLKWADVEGAFGLWMIGIVATCMCFVCELVYYKYKIL